MDYKEYKHGPIGETGLEVDSGSEHWKHNAYTGGDTREGSMSCNEIMRNLFVHDFIDELEVANKYLDYAIAFDNEGKDMMADKFAEMGYEEYTHAHVQRDMLVDGGFALSAEQAALFEQTKHRIHTLFRS